MSSVSARAASSLMKVAVTLAVGAICGLSGGSAEVFAQGSDPDSTDPTTSRGVSLHSFEAIQYPDVRGIAQDRQGFVWFGVNHQFDGGLIRHDGHVGKRYVHDPDDDTSLSHDQVSLTYIDRDEVLWVGTIRGGLNRYNATTDDFTRFLHREGDDSTLPSNDIKAVMQATDGTHWIGTEAGLSRLDATTGVVTSYVHDPDSRDGLPGSRVLAIVEDPDTGELWLGTNGGLSVFDPATASFRNYLSDGAPHSLSDESVQAITRDSSGVWWIGTGAGLDKFDPETDRFDHVLPDPEAVDSAKPPSVESLLVDSQGRLWIGHDSGLHQFDRDSGQLVDFVDRPTWDVVVGGSSVHSLFEDADGAVWIGTRLKGVARISPVPRSLEYFRHEPDDPASIDSDFVARVDATEEGMWIVTDVGVEFFDGREFSDYTSAFGLEGGWPTVHGILATDDGAIWLGFNDGRLQRIELASGAVTTYTAPAPADRAAIWPVAQAANGDLWYRVPWGFGIGVLHPNGESELLIGDSLDARGPEQAYGYNTAHHFDDAEQVLWVTGLGLTRIDVATGAVEVFPYDEEFPESVANQLWSVSAGPDGHLWLAASNGVHQFDPVERQYVRVFRDELPAAGATDARFGPDGRLWTVAVSTLAGIDTDTGETLVYSAADESVAKDRLDMENWVATKLEIGADGRMYAPTLEEGLVAFSPLELRIEPSPPNVVLTSFELFGEEVPTGSDVMQLPVNLATDLTLASNQNTFTFGFSAPGFEHPEHHEYRYRLDGFDSEWHYTTIDRRFATYTNVPPGDYTFRVQASHGSDRWTPEGLAVTVTVMTPWYRTWWAQLIAMALFIALVVVVVRWRTRSQRQRTRALEERLDERMRHEQEREVLLAQVRQQTERLQGILLAAPVGVVLLGPDRDVLIENTIAADEFGGLASCDESGRLDAFAGVPIDELIDGEPANVWSTVSVERDGVLRTITMTTRSIASDVSRCDDADPTSTDDAIRGWALIWDDITELQDLQQRRAREDRLAAVGRFAAGIAHDVNNVLTVIGLNAELLSLDPTVGKRAHEYVDRIVRETGNASQVVTQILDFSRQSVSEREALDATALVGAQVRQLGELMEPGVELTFHGDRPSTVLADPVQLERVVLNLVNNAHDAVGESGTIAVLVEHVPAGFRGTELSSATATSVPEAWVRLAVIDNGSGIDGAVLPTIFEPFVTTKGRGKGTGLGLAQVAGIAAEHDGRVTVETEVGVGTTVSVLFPAADLSEFDHSASTVSYSAAGITAGAGRETSQLAIVIDGEVVS